MVDVYLRKTTSKDPLKEYALMVRDFSSGIEVEWTTLCYMDGFSAQRLDGETISYWNIDGLVEDTHDIKALKLQHPSLREAWENYQTLKTLFTSK